MSSADDPADAIRREMIDALDRGKWWFTKRAQREGLEAFRRYSEHPSDEQLIDYIHDLLESGVPLVSVTLSQPPFPSADPPFGNAFEIRNADGQGLYIKLRFDWPDVQVMSFHY